MSLKLFSHVNADGDLIEAWLRHYLRLGVDEFHLILHGPVQENQTLLDLVPRYPIVVEEMYEGPFDSDQKKNKLDALLARNTDQWVLVADSDEFVEFPYGDIRETAKMLSDVNANLLAAPMLQRLTLDGSLETPSVIDDPFKVFPLCSVPLYRKMGMKGDIFKFPLFYCVRGTSVCEEGNHHPPLGSEPRASGMLGVTHHFKFRRTVSQRLERMIRSEHPWRHESVQLGEYLDSHSNRLPLSNSFSYSREELFRRRLLRRLPAPTDSSSTASTYVKCEPQAGSALREPTAEVRGEGSEATVTAVSSGKRILFLIPRTTGFGGLENQVLALLQGLKGEAQRPVVVCLEYDSISEFMDPELRSRTTVKCVSEPKSFREWLQLIRKDNPDIVVFCYRSFMAFPWDAPLASVVARVRRRIAIQHLVALPPFSQVKGTSPKDRLRRLLGRRARYRFKSNLTARFFHRTICVSKAVWDSLVKDYAFPVRSTIIVRNGVSTSVFAPCERNRAVTRSRFDIGEDEFLLICVAKLIEAKGVDIVLHAVSRALRQGVSCKCIILGDGPLREGLQREANSLGLSGHIFFEGFKRDVRPYLQAGSAFVLTSHSGGLSHAVLEAMACGLPCIVTNGGGSGEAVKNRVTGLVISPGSVDGAENAIVYLATHSQECAEMAARSRETAHRAFELRDKIDELRAGILYG